jgi:hypothetical protein
VTTSLERTLAGCLRHVQDIYRGTDPEVHDKPFSGADVVEVLGLLMPTISAALREYDKALLAQGDPSQPHT